MSSLSHHTLILFSFHPHAEVAMNTTLSAATGGITVFILRFALLRKYDVGGLCNGILAGLVSITAGCGNMECGSAVATGFIGAVFYQGSSMLLQKLKIDDPVDAAPVHGFCGIWGVLACGLFDWGKGFDHYHGWQGFGCMPVSETDSSCKTGIGGSAIGAQFILIIMVILWSGILSTIIFLLLKITGALRISEEVEEVGMDSHHHSPTKAYALETGTGQTQVKTIGVVPTSWALCGSSPPGGRGAWPWKACSEIWWMGLFALQEWSSWLATDSTWHLPRVNSDAKWVSCGIGVGCMGFLACHFTTFEDLQVCRSQTHRELNLASWQSQWHVFRLDRAVNRLDSEGLWARAVSMEIWRTNLVEGMQLQVAQVGVSINGCGWKIKKGYPKTPIG